MSFASIEAFADLWLLELHERQERVLMAIEVIKPFNVYVDESIQHQGPKTLYAVTAYIATFERWIECEKRWQEVLDNFGSPPFHMTEFMAREGDFKDLGWSDEKRNNYVELLCATAAEHTIMGAGCGV